MGIAETQLAYERTANEGMGALFLEKPSSASAVRFEWLVPMNGESVDELCLFVSHAPAPELKAHVVDHILELKSAGVAVVLILNTDHNASAFKLPAELTGQLFGCIVRQNVGFDFAAWSHAYCLIERKFVRRRLYCVNDSIVGPLDRMAYRTLLQRIRASSADLLGLTANPDPHDHLQSYFLVFNEKLLHSSVFDEFMRGIVNMPFKQNVIDCYEIWLSRFFERKGFTTAVLFPKLSREPPPRRNDTLISWKELIDAGFPFVKSMVLREPSQAEDVRRLIPARYR